MVGKLLQLVDCKAKEVTKYVVEDLSKGEY